MLGTVLYGPRDVRFEERDTPTIIKPSDAFIRISATCAHEHMVEGPNMKNLLSLGVYRMRTMQKRKLEISA